MTKRKVIIDTDSNLDYEYRSLRHHLFDLTVLPVLSILPRGFQKLIKKSHKSAKEVIDNATTHKALEVLYHKGKDTSDTKNPSKAFFRKVWFSFANSKAVRNRLRLVERELNKQINDVKNVKKSVRILSIAAGSARAIIETLEKHNNGEIDLHATFLDKNIQATEYSQNLAKGVSGIDFAWINTTAGSFLSSYTGEKFDVVEMVGLMDYFEDDKAVDVFSSILNNLLKDGGILITANISHNNERRFLERIIGWHMIYRTAEEFSDLVEKAGFDHKNITTYYEPLKIHTVVVARK